MERKLRVGVKASFFLAALLLCWWFFENVERTQVEDESPAAGRGLREESNSPVGENRRPGPIRAASSSSNEKKSGEQGSGVEIPKLVVLLGEDLAARFEGGGPFEPRDLPKVGRALQRMERVVEGLWESRDSQVSAAAHERYLELQKKYALIMSMVARDEVDAEARARLERYRREREKLLEQHEAGGASGWEGRDRDLARLKRNILRGEGEELEPSSDN